MNGRCAYADAIALTLGRDNANDPETIKALIKFYGQAPDDIGNFLFRYHFSRETRESFIDNLTAHLKDPNPAKRCEIAYRLTRLDLDSDRAVEILISLLNDQSELVTSCVANDLGKMGAPAKAAIPALQALAADDKQPTNVRRNAKEAIEKITSDTSPAIKSP